MNVQPHIDTVRFGAIVIAGERFDHDVVIGPAGRIRPRPAHLSKQRFGTSHLLSLAEIQAIWEEHVETLIVGAGWFNRVRLSPEAQAYLQEQQCTPELYPLHQAVRRWNRGEGRIMGLFHLTC